MSRITEYTAVSAFDENDVLIKDGENGTKIISVEDAAAEFRRLCGINGDISDITDSLSAFGTNLAGVETTFIATKNYNIGDLFVIDNVLYRATATIASGSEIDPETNCEETSFSTVIEAMNDILAGKADANGTYDNLIAGNAKQLVGTVFTEDDTAYTFRTAGGSADIGDREYDEIVGGSVVWNQMVQNGNFADGAEGWRAENEYATLSVDDGIATVTLNTASPNNYTPALHYKVPSALNHVYLIDVDVMPSKTDALYFGGGIYSIFGTPIIEADVWNSVKFVMKATSVSAGNTLFSYLGFKNPGSAGVAKGDTLKFRKIRVHDLTQMFGSEIADHVYELEQAEAGAGVAWFRKYFPKDYYEYNAGELMHVSDLQSHDMVGFNIVSEPAHVGGFWNANGVYGDNSLTTYASFGNNKWAVVPGMDYCFSVPNRAYPCAIYMATFDKAGNYIDNKYLGYLSSLCKLVYTMPSDVHYIGVYLYRNTSDYPGLTEDEIKDICINLSWDGERDGEYEPYVKHSYPLDSSLTLRGIPKLSTDGKLYYDGDHYKSDGTVERRYGIVDLGTPEWWYSSNTETPRFFKTLQNCKAQVGSSAWSNIKAIISTSKYKKGSNVGQTADAYGKWGIYNGVIYITDSDYTDVESFKAAMSGVYLVYELAEPTTEEAQPFQSPQIVDDFGTEEYVTSSIVPVGHITQYDSNLRAKLEMAPNSPDGDGDYLVRQTSGQNEYVPYTDSGRITALEGKIPTPPSTDGTYVLKCTVADGTPTYSWVSA